METKNRVKIVYKNWKGITSERLILPERIWWGSTEWHTEDQWMMRAIDLEKNEVRNFAMTDVLSWTTAL